MAGTVVLSLDLELRWGVHDTHGLNVDGYRENIEGVAEATPRLLRLLEHYDIAATWATVGAIGCGSWDEYFRRAPPPPQYRKTALRVKPEYADIDPEGRLHFAPDLIQKVLSAPRQELGSHTFSHLFMREAGITAADVAADLRAASTLFRERFGVEPISLVFPRNQPAFIDVIRASPIRVWRGNPGPWFFECEDSEHNGPIPRALRLLDGVTPFLRRASPLVDGDMNRATLYLRLNLPKGLWSLHMQRIRHELDTMRPDEIVHLWFHPHNLGAQMEERLVRVEEVLEMIAKRMQRGTLVSRTMSELIAKSV